MRSFKIITILVLFFLCISNSTQAQYNITQFRGLWVATVSNIDWPSKKGLSADAQKAEFIQLADKAKWLGINALIVQVRPAADAFYASPYEPWSQFLSGTQGVPPYPYYDPLEFMVTESHKRGLEFHAWFNPFRSGFTTLKAPLAANNIRKTHPEWMLRYGDKYYFDPGIPEVRFYVAQVIADVVKRYNIDGVHLDDYFYPYRIAGVTFPDYNSFKNYGLNAGFTYANIDDWRRDNVNQTVALIHKSIKDLKPYVRFGISPFGVWRNASKDPRGSYTRGGQTCYDDLFADVLYWMDKGWVDYVAPQLYWERGHRAADYYTLAQWWAKNTTQNTQLYIGHGVYNLGSKAAWQSTNELPAQLRINQQISNIQGSIYYSAASFKKYMYHFDDSLQQTFYTAPTYTPAFGTNSFMQPEPQNFTIEAQNNGLKIKWQAAAAQYNANCKFVLYKSKNGLMIDTNNPTSIDRIVYYPSTEIIITALQPNTTYHFKLVALNGFNQASNATPEYEVIMGASSTQPIGIKKL